MSARGRGIRSSLTLGTALCPLLQTITPSASPTIGKTRPKSSSVSACLPAPHSRDRASLTAGWISSNMPDLDTESPHVVKTLHTWIHDLVQAFSIDFLRIDTVKHIRRDFWPDFIRVGGVAAMGEVLHGGMLVALS